MVEGGSTKPGRPGLKQLYDPAKGNVLIRGTLKNLIPRMKALPLLRPAQETSAQAQRQGRSSAQILQLVRECKQSFQTQLIVAEASSHQLFPNHLPNVVSPRLLRQTSLHFHKGSY